MSQSTDPNSFLIARPVDEAVICRIESQTEVASSAAFQSVDDQYYAGKLTSTEVAVYKARYMKLHEALRKTRDNEFYLIQLGKRYMGEIDEQQQILARADQFPDNALTEPSQLRAQILSYYNSAMEADERVEMLAYEAALLREERKLLNRDYSRLPTAELEAMDDDVDILQEMERRMKLMQNQCQDLWLQIDMLKMEAKRSREQLRQASDQEQEVQQEASELSRKLSDVKAEWVLATDLPSQYSKEVEKARKYKSNAEKELQNKQQEYAEMSEMRDKLELHFKQAEADETAARTELSAIRLSNVDQKQALEKTLRLFDSWTEMEMMNRTEKARLILRLHMSEQEKKDLLEEQSKIIKEKESYIRNWKKALVQIEFLTESLKLVTQIHDKARARYVVTPRYDGEMLARKRRLARSIQHLQQCLDDEQKRNLNETAHLGRTVGVTERRLAILEHLRAENWELIRLTTTLTEGLGRAIFEYTSARNKYERLIEELEDRTKEMKEQQKILEELNARLTEVSAMYTKMKLERNKCVSLLQTSVKLALDTRERLRLHSNEAEIIIYRLQKQDQDLARERTLFGNAIVQRDHKRNEVCKMAQIHAEQSSRREQMRRSIHRINMMFNQSEAETLSLRKARERNAQIRNERAILLIERNQEVYILQERIAAQDSAGFAAELQLHALDEEYEYVNRYYEQLRRYMTILKNAAPSHKKVTNELQGLIHQLVGSRMELARLVQRSEDPDVPGRLRLLGGKDPSQNELWITLGKLERRMAAKEEDMAEKNLTYEAVCRLVDSLQVRTSAGKDDTLLLATEVNKVKARLIKIKNMMKTMYAEMVVCGTECKQLKDQVDKLERKLDMYNLRIGLGQPPSPTLERKWNNTLRIAQIREAYKHGEPPKIVPMRSPGSLPMKSYGHEEDSGDILMNWTSAPMVVQGRSQRRARRRRVARYNQHNSVETGILSNVHSSTLRLPPIVNANNPRQTSGSHQVQLPSRVDQNLRGMLEVRPVLRNPRLTNLTETRLVLRSALRPKIESNDGASYPWNRDQYQPRIAKESSQGVHYDVAPTTTPQTVSEATSEQEPEKRSNEIIQISHSETIMEDEEQEDWERRSRNNKSDNSTL
ncbi:unnamed protein product [Calicophoron daubneyi]|uniref:Uncharacterized protein n=1 Tax=Calicophoron daubneyi TaxID=300641 RepID=A0AAV2T149_CALDB